jgi:hypothetical protein
MKFGCHCDLEPGMPPDGCVLDDGLPELCAYARKLISEDKGKTDCPEWREIKIEVRE